MSEAGGGGGDDRRSLAEAAAFFEVSVPTLKRWIDAGAPVASRGSNGVAYELSLRAIADWRRGRAAEEAAEEERKRQQEGQLRLELLGDGALTAGDAGTAALTPAQRAAALQEELARTKLAAARRELVPFEDLALRLGELLARLRQSLRQIPDTAGPELGLSPGAMDHLAELIDAALTETAEGIAAMIAGDGAPAGGEAAAGAAPAPAGALL